MHPGEVQNSRDLAHQVIGWNDLIQAERIEQPPLVPVEPPHHRQPPLPPRCRVNHGSQLTATDFCNMG